MSSPAEAANKKSLLLISPVFPFPGKSGQQQRVFNSLRAFEGPFRVTFLGLRPDEECEEDLQKLERLCHRVILLPRIFSGNPFSRAVHRVIGVFHFIFTGLRFSNYIIGCVELTPGRIERAVGGDTFDVALLEYWHAWKGIQNIRKRGTLCVLDMHDILWKSWEKRLGSRKWLPRWTRRRAVAKYRRAEESAWLEFDGIIAINALERDEVSRVLEPGQRLFYAPMGIDLDEWPYSWSPAIPPRVAYYGGLGNPDRQRDALRCYRDIMPLIWEKVPEAEFWFIGSNPPGTFRDIETRDSRIKVTGFVPAPQSALTSIHVLLCPFEGTFGFRSRLVEAMALGVPVVASPDAAWGMELEDGEGIRFSDSNHRMAEYSLKILTDNKYGEEQSGKARSAIVKQYSLEATYGKLADDLLRGGDRR